MALGSEVTVKKVVGHPRGYKWRANFIEEGRRKQKYFKTKAAADEWSEERKDESLEHGTGSALTPEERSAVIESRITLSTLDWDLRSAVDFAAKTKSALAPFGVTPEAAIDLAVDYYRRSQKSVSISELVEEVIQAKKNAGRSKRHERDLRSKLDKFKATFAKRPAATLESGEIEEWLHKLKLAPGSVNSYRRILVLLFNYAVKRGYSAANPVINIDRVREKESEPEILTIEELNSLLTLADEKILPAFVIGAFAGLRSSEIEGTADHDGLDWSEIDFDENTILVRADVAKGRRKRHVPISPNLLAWLKPRAKRKGKIWPDNGRKLHEAARRKARFGKPGTETVQEIAKKVKLKPWPKNALRHSYATYHLAEHRNAAELVVNMGHNDDAETLFNHYRGIVKPKQAKAYWEMVPESGNSKVISIAS
jgi:integrase